MYSKEVDKSTIVKTLENQMEKHFHKRTNFHINLVRKYLDKIIDLDVTDNKILEQEKYTHDVSKFKEPEYTPYLHITWKYKCERDENPYCPPEKIINLMNDATFHHIKYNKHHPEYWDDNVTMQNLNLKDRDKPSGKMVDATNMPLSYVASMTADWLAVSEEKKTNPFDWAKKNINIRWKFTQDQVNLIYKILNALWTSKPNLVIDFDDTIAITSSDHKLLGLKEGVKEAILKLKEQFHIIIMSARNSPGYEESFKEMVNFLKDNDVYYDEIAKTTDGKPMAMYYIDDKAIHFQDNWKSITDFILSDVGQFKITDFKRRFKNVY